MAFRKYCLLPLALLLTWSLAAQEIQWMSWEEAAAANEKKPRKMLVDVYTDWCGWCKRMDATTFRDPAVVAYVNAHFYAIKLNAEQKESIFWQDQEFKWLPGGRDGVNKLAYDLLDGKLSYPTFVLLDPEYARILISPGYKEGAVILKELRFAAENHYQTTGWEEFKARS